MEWISVKERFPDYDGQYVIGYCLSEYSKDWYVGMIRYSKNLIGCAFWDDSYNSHPRDVTHWMPLPPPPESI